MLGQDTFSTLYTHPLRPSDLFLKPLSGGGGVPGLAHTLQKADLLGFLQPGDDQE